jgi:hypothetical protein
MLDLKIFTNLRIALKMRMNWWGYRTKMVQIWNRYKQLSLLP